MRPTIAADMRPRSESSAKPGDEPFIPVSRRAYPRVMTNDRNETNGRNEEESSHRERRNDRDRNQDRNRDQERGELPRDRDPDASSAEEPIEVPIEEVLDLHPFAPRDILDVVDAYLEAAAEKGLREVRLIHGKGIGFQRERVRELLARHALVESFRDAPVTRGHWGATLVILRQS